MNLHGRNWDKGVCAVWFHLRKIIEIYSDQKQISGWIGQEVELQATKKHEDTLGGINVAESWLW